MPAVSTARLQGYNSGQQGPIFAQFSSTDFSHFAPYTDMHYVAVRYTESSAQYTKDMQVLV